MKRSIVTFAAAIALLASTAAASDEMHFSALEDVSQLLVQKINAETVRIDMSCWYLSDDNVASALLSRFEQGVPVRLIGDRASIFEIDQPTRVEFYRLAAAGVPIRLRYNPTWYPEIDHMKATVFVGQNLVSFGSANYSPYELTPFSPTNYHDETTMFSTDPVLVGAFETKFDQLWHDTTFEPESIYGGPPYFKNWADACALESACSDWKTQYPNPAPMNIDTSRLAPDNPMPADLIWGQGPDFNDRVVQEINAEQNHVDFTIYRLTVDNITNAILSKFQSGVPVRLITEPQEYLNRAWPEFWITHANEDKLWAAGVPMKQRQHEGLTHMKTLITSTYATNASSNNAAAWQRDNNYFINVKDKPDMYAALQNRFNDMWNDSSAFVPFQPLGPDTPSLANPVSGQTGVSTMPTFVWSTAVFATNYDVLLGTSPTSLAVVANVPAQIVNNPPSTYSWTPTTALQGGTTYYWQIVARTNATIRDPNLVGPTAVQSFTTTGGGGGGGPVPSPWQTQDVGSTGVTGNASYSNGTFTLQGAGADIWGTADAFRYVYQPVSGDTQTIVRATSLTNTNSSAKAGVMLRATNDASSPMVIVDMTPTGNIEFMARATAGASVQWIASSTQPAPAWLRLARSGNTVTGSVSSNGTNWITIASTTVSFGSSANIGMLAMSHNTSNLTTATFDNVSVGGTPPPPPPPLPSPWQTQDVGSTGVSGNASYSNGTFTLQGAGADIWGTADAFRYAYQPVSGDTQITARAASLTNTNQFAKAGVMLRASNAADSPMVIVDVTPGGVIEFMTRSSSGGSVQWLAGANQGAPAWLRLTRSGNTVTGLVSANGSTWTTLGSTTVSFGSSGNIGMLAMSHNTSTLTTATFDNVSVGGTPPPPPPPVPNIVIYASDVSASALHGWSTASDSASPGGVKLVTPDNGTANTTAPLATPTEYFDVTFSAQANTPYTIWLRLKALNNAKFNDSLWVQFSDAQFNGSAVYPISSSNGLLVNLATNGTGSSLNGWGWQNQAYWLSQATTVTFPTTGTHTMRVQIREDGVELDQIVLSPSQYLSAAPGGPTNDSTIVPKP